MTPRIKTLPQQQDGSSAPAASAFVPPVARVRVLARPRHLVAITIPVLALGAALFAPGYGAEAHSATLTGATQCYSDHWEVLWAVQNSDPHAITSPVAVAGNGGLTYPAQTVALNVNSATKTLGTVTWSDNFMQANVSATVQKPSGCTAPTSTPTATVTKTATSVPPTPTSVPPTATSTPPTTLPPPTTAVRTTISGCEGLAYVVRYADNGALISFSTNDARCRPAPPYVWAAPPPVVPPVITSYPTFNCVGEIGQTWLHYSNGTSSVTAAGRDVRCGAAVSAIVTNPAPTPQGGYNQTVDLRPVVRPAAPQPIVRIAPPKSGDAGLAAQ